MASLGCKMSCLDTAGQGGIGINPDTGLNVPHGARLMRLAMLMLRRREFFTMLIDEIERIIKTAAKNDLTPAIRLNGVSDLRWENITIPDIGKSIFEIFPSVQFYDYSKWSVQARDAAYNQIPNYDVTLSYSGDNLDSVAYALENNHRVAVVFNIPAHSRTQALPTTYNINGVVYDVLNGDEYDLRFLDPTGVIIGLSYKDAKGYDADRRELSKAERTAASFASSFIVNV